MLDSRDFNKERADQIGKLLKERNQTIAVAESVTAGQIQTSLSLAEKALEFFQGGLTAYNIGQKSKHLGIDPIHGICTDCVSERIASDMAVEVTSLFNCNWSIGITGYAAPVPEKNIEELFACVAICCNKNVLICETIKAEKNDPLTVRQYYTSYILDILLKLLQKNP